MSEQAEQAETGGDSVLKMLLPYLLGTALLSAMLVLGVLKFSGGGRAAAVSQSSAVVFDVVKLANAQRAVASAFLSKDSAQSADTASLLMDVSKRTRDAIRKVAGENTLVLVKQGVVSPELPDITDDVLKDLGLPTEVPTMDTMGYLTDVAPSYLTMLQKGKGDQVGKPAPVKSAPTSGSILP